MANVKATLVDGDLKPIDDIFIRITGISAFRVQTLGFDFGQQTSTTIYPKILPDLSDGKGAEYPGENIQGRSFPTKTFAYSNDRSFSLEWKFIALKESDINENLKHKRLLESCVYPRDEISSTPFMPPPICQVKYGKLLGDEPICAVLKSYSVKYDTAQVFHFGTMLPYRFDMSLQFETLYSSSKLPGQEKIAKMGM